MNPKLAKWVAHLVVGFLITGIAFVIHRLLDARIAQRLEKLG